MRSFYGLGLKHSLTAVSFQLYSFFRITAFSAFLYFFPHSSHGVLTESSSTVYCYFVIRNRMMKGILNLNINGHQRIIGKNPIRASVSLNYQLKYRTNNSSRWVVNFCYRKKCIIFCNLFCERFELNIHFISRLSMIVRVNVVLNRTVVVDSH